MARHQWGEKREPGKAGDRGRALGSTMMGKDPQAGCILFNIYLLMWLPQFLLVACGSSLQHVGYSVAVHSLSSCGVWARSLCKMWDLSSLITD